MLDVLPGGPLLLMELAFLLRSVGAEVCWITIQKPFDTDEVIYSLEHKMLDRGVQVIRYYFRLLVFEYAFKLVLCCSIDVYISSFVSLSH